MTEAMLTPWGEALDREHPLPEYPRPQLRRNSYLNLNGIWEYAITKTAEKPASFIMRLAPIGVRIVTSAAGTGKKAHGL